MTWQFYAFLFGPLVAVAGLIVGGFYVGEGWGTAMIVAGGVGLLAWVILIFDVSSSMNSDR